MLRLGQVREPVRREMDRLLHRIENGIAMQVNMDRLWLLCESEGIDFAYLQAFMQACLLDYHRTLETLAAYLQEKERLNSHKIAFIICVNDEEQFSESALYIEHLHFPTGIEYEIIPVREAGSMCAGYEQGRQISNAKYKIYLHQDVLIIRRNLVEEILNLFQDPQVGMIGLAGCETLPASAVWWDGEGVHNKVAHSLGPGHIDLLDGIVPCCQVEAADGVFLATQYDIPWRADIFQGWHFYDISLCQEYRRRGYKILLPRQEKAWIIHQTRHTSAGDDYFQQRDIFLREYQDLL